MARDDLERVRAIVVQDATLQQQLMDASNLKTFIRRVQQLAGEHGCDLSADDIQGAMNETRQNWLGRWTEAHTKESTKDTKEGTKGTTESTKGTTESTKGTKEGTKGTKEGTETLDGWVPTRLSWDATTPSAHACVDWCRLSAGRFKEPFFDQAVETCLRQPFNQLFLRRTPIEALGDRLRASPGLDPSGFIFHLSRCGSTLVTQMLTLLPQTVVLAEADPIHWVLRSAPDHPTVTRETQITWLRWIVGALGQRWSGAETSLCVKFDSWSIADFPLIRQVFPNVPWLFVYRHPVEVIVSHLRRRGSQMVPSVYGIRLLGIDPATAARMRPEEYCARVLAAICEAALAHYDKDRTLLIDYPQLSDEVWPGILDFLRLPYAPDDLARMRGQSRFDAKNPSVRFADDVSAKNREASDLVREVAEQWVMPHYRALEALRRAASAR